MTKIISVDKSSADRGIYWKHFFRVWLSFPRSADTAVGQLSHKPAHFFGKAVLAIPSLQVNCKLGARKATHPTKPDFNFTLRRVANHLQPYRTNNMVWRDSATIYARGSAHKVLPIGNWVFFYFNDT